MELQKVLLMDSLLVTRKVRTLVMPTVLLRVLQKVLHLEPQLALRMELPTALQLVFQKEPLMEQLMVLQLVSQMEQLMVPPTVQPMGRLSVSQ
jgi:hypothetical protein